MDTILFGYKLSLLQLILCQLIRSSTFTFSHMTYLMSNVICL